jgi:hypothetical protein
MKRALEPDSDTETGPEAARALDPASAPASAPAPPGLGVADKQAIILTLLKARSSESFTGQELEQLTGLNILSSVELLQSLARNEGVVLDGEGRYCARFRYAARGRAELVDLIAREGSDPLRWRELAELYPGAEADLCDLTRRAELVRIKSDDMQYSDVVLSRAQVLASLVRVSGRAEVRAGDCMVRTDRDLRMELFRNDVVWVGEPGRAGSGVYRVSSRSMARTGSGGADAELAPTGVHRASVQNFNRAHGAAYSAADTLPHALHHNREYVHAFTPTHMPLDRPWEGASAKGLPLFRMGCTGDARVLWREIVHHKVAYKPKEEGGGAVGAGAGAGAGGALAGSEGEEEEKEEGEEGEGAGEGEGEGEGDGVGAAEARAGKRPKGDAYASTSAAAAAALAAESKAVWDEAGVYASMGGLNAFLGLPPFPDTHRALRGEMERIKMITRCAPGVLEVEMGLPMVAPMTEAERAKLRKSRGPRAIDSRMTQLDATTTENLTEETRAKLKAANEAILLKRLEATHYTHGEEFKDMRR